jgi:type IV pilus assembly protein PilA
MLARIRSAKENDKGFTLIELLVVIIIIGILAAIAIPAFLNQREKAWESAVTSDLKNASIAAESFATDNNGLYKNESGAAMTLTDLEANGFNDTDDVTITVTPASDFKTYTLVGKHGSLAGTWTYSSTDGKITES